MPVLLLPRGLASVPAAAAYPAVTVEMMFDGSSWADVTPYYDSAGGGQIQITRGSSRGESPAIRYDAGTCSIPLINIGRRVGPANPARPPVTRPPPANTAWL